MVQSVVSTPLDKLESNLRKAEIECASLEELFEKVKEIWREPYFEEVIARITELDLSPEEQLKLEKAVRHLLQVSETLPYKEKAKADRRVRRLILALPRSVALDIAKALIHHPRKLRRDIGFRILKKIGIDIELAERFIDQFKKTGDEEFLRWIARSAAVVPRVDYVYLLEHLSDQYWRMRVLAALLVSGNEIPEEIIHRYPFEFTYAVGRVRDRKSEKIIGMLLYSNSEDVEFLSICAWTIGRLRARELLEKLREVINRQRINAIGN